MANQQHDNYLKSSDRSVELESLSDDPDQLPEDDELNNTTNSMSQKNNYINGRNGKSHSNIRSNLGKASTLNKPGYRRAVAIQQRRNLKKVEKTDRRSAVKNSLALFLHETGAEGESEHEEDEDDASLQSDDDDENDRKKESTSGGMRRRRKVSDDSSVGSRSIASRRVGPRGRSKADSDDATVGSVGSTRTRSLSRSRRMSRRIREIPDDVSTGSAPRRRQGELQKPVAEGSVRRRRRTVRPDEEEVKQEDEDVNVESKQAGEPEKRKPTPKVKQRKKKPSVHEPKKTNSERKTGGPKKKKSSKLCKNKGTEIPPPPTDEGETDDDDAHHEEAERKDKVNSLASHLESNVAKRDDRDPEEASEESSRFSFGIQQTLLQFDPTNVDNVTRVRQDEANVKSETIKHADGTESELQIRELEGLPTFEDPEKNLDNSQGSEGSWDPTRDTGNTSDDSGSVSISTIEDNDDDASTSGKSIKHGNNRKEPDRKLHKTKSGKLRAMRSISFNKSLLFRKKKKKDKGDGDGDDSSSSEEEKKSRFGRKKRNKKKGHALLDDDSDEST